PVKPAKDVTLAPPPRPAPLPAPRPSQAGEPTLKTPGPEPVSSSRAGFLQRLNPVRWFSGFTADKPQPGPAPVKMSARPDSVTTLPSEPSPALRLVNEPGDAALPPVTDAVPPLRYKYARPLVPISGNRAEAERFFARGVKDQR